MTPDLILRQAQVISQTRASEAMAAEQVRRAVAAHHRKRRELRHVVGELSSAVTSETEAKADTVHLGGQVAV